MCCFFVRGGLQPLLGGEGFYHGEVNVVVGRFVVGIEQAEAAIALNHIESYDSATSRLPFAFRRYCHSHFAVASARCFSQPQVNWL